MASYCQRCAKERPLVKAYPQMANGKPGRYRVWACLTCGERVRVGRYRAQPTRDDLGKLRPSQSEAACGLWLAQQERAGLIRELRRSNDQPRETYALEFFGTIQVCALLEDCEEITSAGHDRDVDFEHLARLIREVRISLRKIASYTPDYSYVDCSDGKRHVIDVKGSRKTDLAFSKTRALLKLSHGIDVEVRVPTSLMQRAVKTLNQVVK